VLIVPRGSAPTAIELRRKEAEAVRERVQSCDEASTYFRSMQNVAVKEPVTKTSADIPGPLREVLDKTLIGHMTAPEVTKQGVELFALCGRKPTTIDSPKKKEIPVSQSKCYNEIGPVPSSVTISLYSSTSTQHLELQGNTIPARR